MREYELMEDSEAGERPVYVRLSQEELEGLRDMRPQLLADMYEIDSEEPARLSPLEELEDERF